MRQRNTHLFTLCLFYQVVVGQTGEVEMEETEKYPPITNDLA
jgi:hypothetical protein